MIHLTLLHVLTPKEQRQEWLVASSTAGTAGPLLRVTSLSHPISQSVMHRLCPYYCRVHCFYLTPHPADSLCLSHPSLCTELTLPLVHILYGYFPKEVVAQGMAEAATLDEEQQTMEAPPGLKPLALHSVYRIVLCFPA